MFFRERGTGMQSRVKCSPCPRARPRGRWKGLPGKVKKSICYKYCRSKAQPLPEKVRGSQTIHRWGVSPWLCPLKAKCRADLAAPALSQCGGPPTSGSDGPPDQPCGEMHIIAGGRGNVSRSDMLSNRNYSLTACQRAII